MKIKRDLLIHKSLSETIWNLQVLCKKDARIPGPVTFVTESEFKNLSFVKRELLVQKILLKNIQVTVDC